MVNHKLISWFISISSSICFLSSVNALELTDKEVQYLNSRGEVSICTDPDWMPFEGHNHQGEYIGIASEYISYIEKQLGIEFKHILTDSWHETLMLAKKGECDVIPFLNSSALREEYLLFTAPYFSSPTVFVTDDGHRPIADFDDLTNEHVAIVKGYIYDEILKPIIPSSQLIYVNSSQASFIEVVNGDVDVAMESIHSASYIIAHNGYANLKIAGVSSFTNQFKMGISKKDTALLAILNKAISEITPEMDTQILRKWVSLKFDNTYHISNRVYFAIISFSILVIAIVGYVSLQNRRLRYVSNHDSLTGILNRRSIEHALNQQISVLKRYERPFSVIMIDVDYFKSVNDTYGHVVGDQVLIKVAQLLKSSLRDADSCGRWGGEEFLVICPETEENDILHVAEILRIAIDKFNFNKVHHTTVSLGATQARKNETAECVIGRCDDALYMAKDNGRNRSVVLPKSEGKIGFVA